MQSIEASQLNSSHLGKLLNISGQRGTALAAPINTITHTIENRVKVVVVYVDVVDSDVRIPFEADDLVKISDPDTY
jgi:hypothetical protein